MCRVGLRRNDLVRAQVDEEIVGAVTDIEEPEPGKRIVTVNQFGRGETVRIAADLLEVKQT